MVQLKSCLKVLIRPVCFLILLGACASMVFKLSSMTKKDEHIAASESSQLRDKIFSEVEATARLLIPLNTSAQNLVRALGSSLNDIELTFPIIQTKVAPVLFVVLSTVPFLSQVGYLGSDGLFFSFYCDEETYHSVAVYCNSSYSSSWYSQPVNRDTGKPFGDAVLMTPPTTMNKTWFGQALNNTGGYASLETGWNKAQDLQFFHTVAMDGRGLITLGFLAQKVTDHFRNMDFHGGDFHLATTNGVVLVQTKLPNTHIVVVSNGTIAVQSLTPHHAPVTKVSCKDGDEFSSRSAKINGQIEYEFYCSTIEIAGIQSLYVLAFPSKDLVSLIRKNNKLAHTLLVLVFVSVIVSVSTFLYFIVRATRREMFLCAALMKQMESTQQAERKSMNKSVAFASASHDARASLAAITGLLELSQEDATPGSELAANLVQMSTCAKDLLGILNTVLDTSKIEAGKMQLEEEEFNLVQLLEDVIDLYYTAGLKKGVDIVFDPCDGSILHSHLVKGDRGKLKQILCNLLGNAVKFTSEGHVSVHAMVKKTVSVENSIIASNHSLLTKCLSRLCYKDREGFKDLDALHIVQHNPNYTEFEFEVNDTGKGIPRDKWKSVFENFVQVNETAQGQEGVGLGLGIVQSLVRLMGGEISIIEKESGERGTRFRFSIFLTTCGSTSTDFEEERDTHRYFGLHIRPLIPRSEGSHVILVIASDERRRMSKSLIQSLGIRVSSIKGGRDLHLALEKIRHKLDLSNSSSSRKADLTLIEHFSMSAAASNNSSSGGNDSSMGIKDGTDHPLPHYRKSNSKSSSNFVLIVVDTGAGPFLELCSTVAKFRKDIQDTGCKVVWLDNPILRNAQSSISNGDWLATPCDYILSKPFHGSRLYQVLGLLPEYGGTLGCSTNNVSNGFSTQLPLFKGCHQLEQIVVHESTEPKRVKPLNGKRILVVEDSEPLRKVTTAILCKLGADVDACENGQEAVDKVCRALGEQRIESRSKVFPYNCIFMDCEMPILNGYEATRLIRVEEKRHGIHIPIIALTAHAAAEDTSKTVRAGMDAHLTKPLLTNKLLDIIRSLDAK